MALSSVSFVLLVASVCSAVNTEFAQVPQVIFPGRAPVNRELSLQQQTQILKDIQHRFTPLQIPASTQQGPLLYSHQATFPAGPPQAKTPVQPPFTTFASTLQQQSQPAVQQTIPGNQETIPSNTLRQQTFVPSNGVPTPIYSTIQQTLTASAPSLQQNNYLTEPQVATIPSQNISPQNIANGAPRGRFLESEPEGEQVLLQADRQKLFEQIKEYNRQYNGQRPKETKTTNSDGRAAAQASADNISFRPTPPASQASSFRPTLNTFLRDESKQQNLKVRQQPTYTPQLQLPTQTSLLQFKQLENPTPTPSEQKKIQEQLQKQFQTQVQQRQELIRKLKLAIANAGIPETAEPSQVEPKPGSSGSPPQVIYLANGNKLQIVNSPEEAIKLQEQQSAAASTTAATPITTAAPPTVSFEELTKGVLPPGADFEVIRHKQDGGLEEVGKLPPNLPQKKVTFVFLEEQPDGTLKVQGVKGNSNSGEQSSPPDVDQIIKRIQEGELKLPPSSKQSESKQLFQTPATILRESQTYIQQPSVDSATTRGRPENLIIPSQEKPRQSVSLKPENEGSYQYFNLQTSKDTEFFPSISFSPNSDSQPSPSSSSVEAVNQFSSKPTNPTTVVSSKPYSATVQSSNNDESVFISASSSQTIAPIRNQFVDLNQKRQKIASPVTTASLPTATLPTVSVVSTRPSVSYRRIPSGTRSASASNQQPRREQPAIHRTRHRSTTTTTTQNSAATEEHTVAYKGTAQKDHIPTSGASINTTKSPYQHPNFAKNSQTTEAKQEGSFEHDYSNDTMSLVLRSNGLYAMAKYLKESSLDSVLNDTGPYTLFAPTDKAFRALLVQLGGPEKAEEKFRENPRLLSGLLLHHVVPGAFPLASLQDEMTGVSLAGTQLRVNTYTTQDIQWNDVKVTTINGARVEPLMHDLAVPQGVVHAVDRVMFPLPVGDVLQTLLADRERRFESFLKAIRLSGLANVLAGSKTHTLLAPTERAFSRLPAGERTRLLTDREAAHSLVARHVARGALYSAGLRYYQLRDTLQPDTPITLTVNAAGQLKVNSVPVVTQNIPATNGVIHAIDTLL